MSKILFVFQVVLDFVYLGKSKKLDKSSAFVALEAARKYNMPLLVEECESVIKKAISVKNACDFYAKSVSHEKLHAFCLDFILENFTNVIKTEDFLSISKTDLVHLYKIAPSTSELLVCVLRYYMYTFFDDIYYFLCRN